MDYSVLEKSTLFKGIPAKELCFIEFLFSLLTSRAFPIIRQILKSIPATLVFP